jgi:hypothetical protein
MIRHLFILFILFTAEVETSLAAQNAAAPKIVGHMRCSVINHTHYSVTVRGVVIDEQGKTAAGATVWVGYFYVGRRPLAEGKTDAQGRFAIPCVVTIYHSGTSQRYDTLDALALAPQRGIGLTSFDFKQAEGLRVQLMPVTTVTGTIKGCDDKPVKGAQVVVHRLTGVESKRPSGQKIYRLNAMPPRFVLTWVLGKAMVSHSDDKGQFQVSVVPVKGRADVNIRVKGMTEGSEYLKPGRAPIVTLHYAGTLAGRLVDAQTKQPLKGVGLQLMVDAPTPTVRTTRTDAQGRFRFEGLWGAYTLSVPGYPVLPINIPIYWCEQHVLSDIRVSAGATVTGKVLRGNRGVVAGVGAREVQVASAPQVTVTTTYRCPNPPQGKRPSPKLSFGGIGTDTHYTVSAADGSFTLRLPAGTWEIRASATKVISKRASNVSTAKTQLQVKEGERVSVTLRLDS